MRVEVVRALGAAAAEIKRVCLDVPEGACVLDAVQQSGLAAPEIVGYAIYGERVAPHDLLREGDRLELLRGLLIDPKQARRRRAQMQRSKP